jgi:glycosyltransferase involved in cell wall biosynthesis
VDISVVVCTKDRAEALRRCLAAIFKINFDQCWEVIVVDNSSNDDTPRVIAEMEHLSPVPFRSLVERHPGNSAGRNAAIDIARGEVVFFTDDDCIVDCNVLREVWRIFADRRTGFAGGRILLFNPNDYPISLMEESRRIEIPPGSMVYPGLVQGSNMAFRRKALIELGGFDPLFGAGAVFAGEDLELATRASMQGWHGGYFPGPTVYHDHGRNRARAMTSERQYDFGIGAYYGKFLLDAPTRWTCVLTWCRRSLRQLFQHPSGLPRQFAGAICYVRLRGGHA